MKIKYSRSLIRGIILTTFLVSYSSLQLDASDAGEFTVAYGYAYSGQTRSAVPTPDSMAEPPASASYLLPACWSPAVRRHLLPKNPRDRLAPGTME